MQYFSRIMVLHYALEVAKEFGVEPSRILLESNNSEQLAHRDAGYLPTNKLIDAVEMAALLSDRDDFGIVWGQRSDYRTFGALGAVVAHHQVLSMAVAELGVYMSRLGTGYSYVVNRNEDGSQLQFVLNAMSLSRPRHYCEGMMMMMVRFGRLLSEGKWNPARVTFPHRRMSSLATYESAFRCPVEFEQDFVAAYSPHSEMDMAISVETSPINEMLQRVLATAQHPTPDNLPAQVALLVPRLLPVGRASATNVASMLNISPRTLQRRLSEEGLSFKQIVNEARETIVRDQIRLGQANGEKLAALLGYSEPSAASRFVRNYLGKTASELKSQAKRGRS